MKYQCWWTDSVFQSKVWQFLLTISLPSGALWWQEKQPSNIPVKFVIVYVIKCSLKVAIMLLNSGLQSSPQQRKRSNTFYLHFHKAQHPWKKLYSCTVSGQFILKETVCFAAILSLAVSCFPLLDVQETQWILLALLFYRTGYFPFLSYKRGWDWYIYT